MHKSIAQKNDVKESYLIEPIYLSQAIEYTADKDLADVYVNARHTLADYLLIGIIALARSVEGKTGSILVYNEMDSESSTIGIPNGRHQLKKVRVHLGAFSQVPMPAEAIYQKLCKGSKVSNFGLSISLILMEQFLSFKEGISKEILSELNLTFSHFDDLDVAQKDAFWLIKKCHEHLLQKADQ